MRFKNLFLEALIDDIDKQLNLLVEEILHMSYIIRFFNPPYTSKHSNSCSYRMITFRKMKEIAKNCADKTFLITEKWIKLRDKIKNNKLSIENSREIISWQLIFEDFIFLKNKIKKSLDEFDFIQKKLLSYQSGFQHYYPTPKITSFREATKTHLYMEKIAEDLFKIITDKNFNVLFFWDYSPDVHFLEERESLIVNTDFFLPHRQSHWIILFHEVFHYLLLNAKEYEIKEFLDLENYIETTINDCRLALIKYGFDVTPDPNLIKDVFIDSLLVRLYNLPYMLPISIRLFAFDELTFSFPYRRNWKIRLNVLSNIYVPENHEVHKRFQTDFSYFLEFYNNLQFMHTAKTIREEFFVIESIIEGVLSKKIKKFNLKPLKEKLIKAKEPWINTYLTYAQEYTNRYLGGFLNENLEETKKEGRAVCYIFQELCCNRGKQKKDREQVIENIKKGFSLKVYQINLLKFRFDREESPFKSLKEDKISWSYGVSHYNILSIRKGNINEKVDSIEKFEENRIIKNMIFEEEPKEVSDTNSDIYMSLLDKGIQFYKEELSLTLFKENDEEERAFEEIIEKQGEYTFILMKAINKPIDETSLRHLNCWNQLKNFIQEKLKIYYKSIEANVFIFSSFDWFSYLILIALKSRNNQSLKLEDILKFLKKNIILSNNQKLTRTETLVFIGNKSCNVHVPPLNILLRISSKDLGKSLSFIKDLKNINIQDLKFNIYSSFGIRDIIIQTKNEVQLSDLTDFIEEIFKTAKGKDVKISDIQLEPLILWDTDI